MNDTSSMVNELPMPPAVADNGLVLALAAGLELGWPQAAESPFGSALPSPAQLVVQAIEGPRPTALDRQFRRRVGDALSALALAAGSLAAACAALSPLNAFNALQQVGLTPSHPSLTGGMALEGARPTIERLVVDRLAFNEDDPPAAGAEPSRHLARQAVYTLNGVRTVAPSNTIALQGGRVRIELLAAAPGVPQTVTVGVDAEALLAAVGRFAVALGALAAVMADHRAAFSSRLAEAFEEALLAIAPRLRAAGFEVGPDLEVSLDEAAFAEACNGDPVRLEAAITGPEGAAQRMGQLATMIMSAPISSFGAPGLIPAVPAPRSHPTPPMILASHTLGALLYAQVFAQGLFINNVL